MVHQMRVVLGGTFDVLHAGHEALLSAAFEGRPEEVVIGLTTDRFAKESRTHLNAFSVRERNLKRLLAARKWRHARIEAIDDPFGPADDLPDLDVLVVSAERMPVALTLNDARAAKGLRRLAIRAVPMVLAQDGLPISSRRIREGLIDRRTASWSNGWSETSVGTRTPRTCAGNPSARRPPFAKAISGSASRRAWSGLPS